VQRRAERRPGVTGRGLHPDVLEVRAPQQRGVDDAVQRGPAGQRQDALAGPLAQPGGELDDDVLEPALDGRREVGVRRRHLLARAAGRREPVPVRDPRGEAAVAGGVHQRPQVLGVARRPVGGERHHLVLVAGAQEAEVRRQLLVEQAEGVRQELRVQRGEVPVAVVAGEVRGPLAAAVEHQAGAVTARRRESRGRRVRDVVRHEPHLRRIQSGQYLGEEAGRALRVLDA
jgi:hypothetical protein